MRIAKYEFNSKEQFKTKERALGIDIDEDGNEFKNHNHAIVELGNIVIQSAIINEYGEIVTPAVLSEKYHVDVMWRGIEKHPYGWASYSVDLDSEGSHSFLGVNYLENKM